MPGKREKKRRRRKAEGEDRREAMKKEEFCARNSERCEIRRSSCED